MNAVTPKPDGFTPDPIMQVRIGLFANGYQPVPVARWDHPDIPDRKTGELKRVAGKAPLAFGWQNTKGVPATRADTPNTGILTRGLQAVDVDIDGEDDAEVARGIIEKVAGPSPCVRWRENSPRVLLLYRAPLETEPKSARSSQGHRKD